MGTTRPQGQPRIKGRRTVRHVVMVTEEQENQLRKRAQAENVTIPRLLVDAALNAGPSRRAVLLELDGLRRTLADNPEALQWLRNHYGHLESR